jgi:hypothetical protein
MNRYFLIRRLRWPAVLLLAGCVALLKQTGVIEHFWNLFIPLFLITMGLLLLAERMSLTADGDFPNRLCGVALCWSAVCRRPGIDSRAARHAAESTSIVPAHSHDFGDSNGGQS